jgi:hypothetical protein
VYVDVGRPILDGLDHFREAIRSSVDALRGNGDNVGFG